MRIKNRTLMERQRRQFRGPPAQVVTLPAVGANQADEDALAIIPKKNMEAAAIATGWTKA